MLTSATQTSPTFAENTLLTTFTLCGHLLSTFFGVLCVSVGRGGGVVKIWNTRGRVSVENEVFKLTSFKL